ncbi:MAG: PP2C family protein-serine/threonine phosphatase [Ignavibacteriales bacterium]|nr:PP2C family protein-serine/threonine phosphatase [Ignavibacteriales bacterium]
MKTLLRSKFFVGLFVAFSSYFFLLLVLRLVKEAGIPITFAYRVEVILVSGFFSLLVAYSIWFGYHLEQIKKNALLFKGTMFISGISLVVGFGIILSNGLEEGIIIILAFIVFVLVFWGVGGWFLMKYSQYVSTAMKDVHIPGKKISLLKAAILVGGDYKLAIFDEISKDRRWYFFAGYVSTWLLLYVLFVTTRTATATALIAGCVVSIFMVIAVLYAEVLEKNTYRHELRTATELQLGLMPTEDPALIGFDISGTSRPAAEVGGDYFDYVWLDEDKIKFGIVIADVSGKAMKAAMTAVMTSGMVYREIGSNNTPKTILRKINRPMYLKTQKQMFTAMSFAEIDTIGRTLRLSNAGQLPPILKRNDELKFLTVPGVRLPLGVMEEIVYDELTESLSPGDLILFFTDGIPEAMNAEKELFGFERLEQFVRRLNAQLTAKEIIDRLFAAVHHHTGTAPQHDDMTVVVVKVA